MKDESHLFSLLGLGREHALIYRTLLEKGPQTMAGITKCARIHRPAAYRLVPELEKHGLLRRTLRGKRTYFTVENPEKIEHTMEEVRRSSLPIIANMKELFERRKSVMDTTVGYGKKGIAAVYDDILYTLKRGDVFYRYSSSKKNRPRHAYVPTDYERRRDAKQLERYVITNKRTSSLKTRKLERYIKIIPPEFDLFEYDITLLIYGNKVAYIDYSSETAVTIENPAAAEFQKRLFQLLFSKI